MMATGQVVGRKGLLWEKAERQTQGSGAEPTGENCARIGLVGASQTPPPCGLCALLRHANKLSNRPHVSRSKSRGLRIALVDGDEPTRLAVSQIARAQRAAWALEVYHPSCAAGGTSARKGSARPKPLERNPGWGNVPDIVLICPTGDGRSRLACVRKLKALAPELPVLIISGDLY